MELYNASLMHKKKRRGDIKGGGCGALQHLSNAGKEEEVICEQEDVELYNASLIHVYTGGKSHIRAGRWSRNCTTLL